MDLNRFLNNKLTRNDDNGISSKANINTLEKIHELNQQTKLIHSMYIELFGSLPEIYNKTYNESINENDTIIKNLIENTILETNLNQPKSYFQEKNLYSCTLCDKVYKNKENLTLHNLNIHLKHKPYSCNKCSKRFSHRNGKLYHERNKH